MLLDYSARVVVVGVGEGQCFADGGYVATLHRSARTIAGPPAHRFPVTDGSMWGVHTGCLSIWRVVICRRHLDAAGRLP